MVGAKFEGFDVEKPEADITALTGHPNTKIINNNVEDKTGKVTSSAEFEEFGNWKRNAEDNIPRHRRCHHQSQELLRQVQEDCRGGAYGESQD
jgi:hypothetical protein